METVNQPRANSETVAGEHATIIPTGICAIRTRFLPATDKRGERIKAWRADGGPTEDKNRDGRNMVVTVGYDYGMTVGENHAAAVNAYIANRVADGSDSWSGRWVLGSGDDGYFAVKVGNRHQDA